MAIDNDICKITIDSETQLTSAVMSGKANKSQLGGVMKPFQITSAERRERSQERPERSKSKGKGVGGGKETAAVSQSFSGTVGPSKKQKISSVDKLIKKNIR